MAATPAALLFVDLFNEKAKDWQYQEVVCVIPGRTWDKIATLDQDGKPTSVHAFINREHGTVHKAASWNAPVKAVRYHTVEEAIQEATPFGSYLYIR